MSIGCNAEARMKTEEGIRITTGSWERLGEDATRVRYAVFVEEQKVPVEIELDASDPQCVHAVAYAPDGAAVGTGRLLPDAHIGRMAVLSECRGQGVGSLILRRLVECARQRGDAEVVLSAQTHAQAFYAAHGFVPEGDLYLDAGIEHVLMRRRLD